MAACTAIALLLGLPAVLLIDDADQAGQPSDGALAANFFSHEARFEELLQMLTTDHAGLAATGQTRIDFATLARLATKEPRFARYAGVLQQISVEGLRYFPHSGKLVLVPYGEESLERPSKSYLYLPHAQPQSLDQYHGYTWRGPGVYVLTGDRPLHGSWFIHQDMTMEIAIVPY